MDHEAFRHYGHQLVDWLADHHKQLALKAVKGSTTPGEVKALLPEAPPVCAEPFDAVLSDLDRVVTPHLTHWQHPRFFGYFPANALPAGVLGELVSAGLGVLGLSWEASPALTEVEEVVVDWFRQMVDLSPGWRGVINDTASNSTLVALLCARERTSRYGLMSEGLQGGDAPMVVYTSSAAHSSVEKAALLAGFGRANVRLLAVDHGQALRPEALEAAIANDKAAGLRPCAIVATCGTTATTAFDPLDAIAEIARRHGLWLHVDAAMAGSAMILPEMRPLWFGVEGADSLVINAHKWLGVPFDCSLYYVRDEAHLLRVMSTNPSYLQSPADGDVRNLRDMGIPLGRRFRALKLWFVIREQGVTGLQARLRRDLSNAAGFAEVVRGAPGWTVVQPPRLQTVCLHHDPGGLSPAALDAHTRRWAEEVNRSGRAYVTPAIVDGRWIVRVSIGAPSTAWPDIEDGWAAMQAAARSSEAATRAALAGR